MGGLGLTIVLKSILQIVFQLYYLVNSCVLNAFLFMNQIGNNQMLVLSSNTKSKAPCCGKVLRALTTSC